ncbi:hypothetical protein F4677DRAFT_381137 [Hypoxylon crocopeplum]|nr:hypothetical protein F4677DRAFT_381137 [Hypoxylon crocopeplum]
MTLQASGRMFTGLMLLDDLLLSLDLSLFGCGAALNMEFPIRWMPRTCTLRRGLEPHHLSACKEVSWPRNPERHLTEAGRTPAFQP